MLDKNSFHTVSSNVDQYLNRRSVITKSRHYFMTFDTSNKNCSKCLRPCRSWYYLIQLIVSHNALLLLQNPDLSGVYMTFWMSWDLNLSADCWKLLDLCTRYLRMPQVCKRQLIYMYTLSTRTRAQWTVQSQPFIDQYFECRCYT